MKATLVRLTAPSGDHLSFEMVERKGLGHPDTICDHLTEALSQELTRRYIEAFGRVLHYNVDKALLWGGCSQAAFGGGKITQPMEIFLSGRATSGVGSEAFKLEDIVSDVVHSWMQSTIPAIAPAFHLRTHSLVRPGSTDLSALFGRNTNSRPALANDTSIGVGFAPLSRLEAVTLAAEHELAHLAANGHPEIGRDIKVMGLRVGEQARLTVACAFVDRHIDTLHAYLEAKAMVKAAVEQVAERRGLSAIAEVNVADEPEANSLYLTVLGTSAESGDDGQAGRGNRINGLITPFRPMTIESVPGKNAVSHVGKLYNIAASLIAERAARLDGVSEAECLLLSSIGAPLTEPQAATVRLRLANGAELGDYAAAVDAILEQELGKLALTGARLACGELRIGDWPLH